MCNLKLPPEDPKKEATLDDSCNPKRKRAPSSLGINQENPRNVQLNGLHDENGFQFDASVDANARKSVPQNGDVNSGIRFIDRPAKRPSLGDRSFGSGVMSCPSLDTANEEKIEPNPQSSSAVAIDKATMAPTPHARETPASFLSGFDDVFQRAESPDIYQDQLGSLGMMIGAAGGGSGGTDANADSNEGDKSMSTTPTHNATPSTSWGGASLDAEPAAVDRSQRTTWDLDGSRSETETKPASIQKQTWDGANPNVMSTFANLEAQIMQNEGATIDIASKPAAAQNQKEDESNSTAHSVFASLEAELTQNNSSTRKSISKPAAAQIQKGDGSNSTARSVFASLEADLTKDYQATNTARKEDAFPSTNEETNMFDHKPSISETRSRNVFASLEAELIQSNNPSSASDLIDDRKPKALFNTNSGNVFSDLETDFAQNNLGGSDSLDVKPSTVPRRDSGAMETDSMQLDSLEHVNNNPWELIPHAHVPSERQVTNAHSKSVFSNLEEKLGRQEEEKDLRAHVPMQFLTASAAQNSTSSSELVSNRASVGRYATFGRVGPNPSYNSSYGFNDLTIVDEQVMDAGETNANAIDNMETLDQAEQMNNEALCPPSQPVQLIQQSEADVLALGLGSTRSREIIASIEADIITRQQEESRAEANLNRSMFRNQMVIGPYSANFYPATMASRRTSNAMLNMMMQQHRQNVLSHTTPSNLLLDQISHTPIDPLDDASVNSIESCISYDGKSTTIFSIPSQTYEQDIAIQMLNTAINDVVNAPVMPILREFPMITRFVRSGDERGDIQLHHAVRAGSSKAIRRILRVDPSCAMIRNSFGYCPLHTAAQIGNFAATQILCSMVPASAEVQCDEGCVPLHEALTTGAQESDLPQIVATLVAAFPSSVKLTNDEGLLPMHLAAMSGTAHGIRTLLGFGLSTIFARESTEDMLPLDFAIDGLLGTIEEEEDMRDNALLDLFQQCMKILLSSAFYNQPVLHPERDEKFPFLPIHGAAAAQPCRRSWIYLMSTFGAQYGGEIDASGRTPLHTLMSSTLFQDDLVTQATKSIGGMHPTCLTHFDNSGFIPLHNALMNKMPFSVIQCLVQCNGSSVSIPVSDNCPEIPLREMLPFQLAASSEADENVIYLLLRSAPDLIY